MLRIAVRCFNKAVRHSNDDVHCINKAVRYCNDEARYCNDEVHYCNKAVHYCNDEAQSLDFKERMFYIILIMWKLEDLRQKVQGDYCCL